MISNISIHPKTMFKNALNIQDFSFKSHTSTAIIGTNGAGKSTLINTILGI
ncbi:ATP-binding cassette domain-containing protein, partial [Helicobacter pylori]